MDNNCDIIIRTIDEEVFIFEDVIYELHRDLNLISVRNHNQTMNFPFTSVIFFNVNARQTD